MPILEFQVNEAITRKRLNEIIKGLNRVEDANNLQAYVKTRGATYNSLDDFVLVQGIRVSVVDTTPESWLVNDVKFPRAFSEPPVVTVSMFGQGANLVVAYVDQITSSTCTIRVQKINPTNAWPTTMSCNIMAIGPTSAI